MHIAAVMAALEIDDLDRTAKTTLIVVCCRASRHNGMAIVSRARLAADMKVHPNTVSRALNRLVDMGYLSVDRRLGKTSIWTIDPHHLELRPSPSNGDTPSPSDGERRSIGEKRRSVALAAGGGKPGSWSADLPRNPWLVDEETGVAVRNPILDPTAIAECVYCDDHGRLWADGRPVAQCTHRTPDFTVEDILSIPPEQP